MNLTKEQLEVLADVVDSPVVWVQHALASLGPEKGQQAVLDKIERHRARCIQRQATHGAEYLNRAQRKEREKARALQEHADRAAALENKAAAAQAALRETIRQVVLEVLAERAREVKP